MKHRISLKGLNYIHYICRRWSLDEDMDKIRRLQEIYLEDGDLHTDTNEKKFRWKNLGNSFTSRILLIRFFLYSLVSIFGCFLQQNLKKNKLQ